MCYVCLGCGGCGRPKSEMFLSDVTCLICGARMPNGTNECPECGWDQTPGAGLGARPYVRATHNQEVK